MVPRGLPDLCLGPRRVSVSVQFGAAEAVQVGSSKQVGNNTRARVLSSLFQFVQLSLFFCSSAEITVSVDKDN